MTKIRTLDVIEDSNSFTSDDFQNAPAVTPYTVGGKEIKVGDRVVGLTRVDRFPRGVVVDVPPRQAAALVNLKLAELVTD